MDDGPNVCPWCGEWSSQYLFINGHYACLVCKRSVADCCDGERAEPDNGRPA